MKKKLKRVIRQIQEFDYTVLLKVICFLGLIAILIFSASGCATLTDQDLKNFRKEFDRHQPKEDRREA